MRRRDRRAAPSPELRPQSSAAPKQRRRSSLAGVPHLIYVLRDPRTRAIRYVGRTIKPAASRLGEHIAEARRHGPEPVYRWIRRLQQRGLAPQIEVIDTNADIGREKHLCERLVRDGALLLNTMPGAPRLKGPIVVDLEREGNEVVADVAHLGLELRQALDQKEGEHAWAKAVGRLQKRTTAQILRHIAALIENEPDDIREAALGLKYERELADHVAARLLGYVDVEAAQELHALVNRLADRQPTEEEKLCLFRMVLCVDTRTVPGAAELVRRVFPQLRRNSNRAR